MPKAVMEALGLSITKPYHDLYAFDSRVVKCLGVIQDMVVSLTQLPMKSVIMDVVVADITPKFGLLLYRSWEKKVGELYKWIYHMLLFLCLEEKIEGCIESFSLPTL